MTPKEQQLSCVDKLADFVHRTGCEPLRFTEPCDGVIFVSSEEYAPAAADAKLNRSPL
ncbi:MAG: hypothetical protein WC736_14650 [Gallionella sp.]|jgi:hypothetical protein